MQEIRLAHFDHHWEAELARGYLEDAGVPSRLVSDNLAGGHTYVGSVAGASVLVGENHVEAARRVLSGAGLLDAAPRGAGAELERGLERRSLGPVRRADVADLREQLEATRKAEVRHFVRCMLGITPTAVIPVVGLALRGSVALLALLCVLVSLVEGWKWIRAGRVSKRLQEELARLEGEARPESAGTDGADLP